MRAATLHRSGAFSAASSGARLYARECTCTRYFLSVSEKLARPKIRPENSLSSHFRPRPKSVPDSDSNEAGWFRLVVVVGFREKFSPLRNSIRCSLLSKRNEFEDQGNVNRAFFVQARTSISEGNPRNVSKGATCFDRVPFGVTYSIATSRVARQLFFYSRAFCTRFHVQQ